MRSEGTMVLFKFIAIVLCFCWVTSSQELFKDFELHKQKNNEHKQVLILAGQSNMQGRGGVNKSFVANGVKVNIWNGEVPAESHPSPAIFRLNEHFRWELAREPLHKGISCEMTCGVGVGMPFANRILEKDPDFGVIGLVPTAVGATLITNWSGDSYNDPYKNMIARAKVAVKSGGNLRGVVWYQGESDTPLYRFVKNYKSNLKTFIRKTRNDLNSPTLPFYMVIIPRLKMPFRARAPFVEQIRNAQLETNLSNVYKIDGDGLPLGFDGVHLTTQGYVQLGEMLADTFLKNNDSPKSHIAPSPFNVEYLV